MILTAAVILGIASFVMAMILAVRIGKSFPDLHRDLDLPSGLEWWPFWLFHFLTPRKLRALPQPLRIMATVATTSFAVSLILLAFLLVRFLARGGNL